MKRNGKCFRVVVKILLCVCLGVFLLFLLLHLLTVTCSKYQPLSKEDLARRLLTNHTNAPLKRCYKDGQIKPLRDIKVGSFPNGIPMILHTTWKTQKFPEARWETIATECKQLNKRFTFCHWDDEELEVFVAVNYPSFLRHFLSYPYPIQRADVSRYMLLHTYGGFYKDTNVGCRVSFDTIIRNISSLPSSLSDNHPPSHRPFNSSKTYRSLFFRVYPSGIAADFLASSPQHPFFAYLLTRLRGRRQRFGLPYIDVIYGTGPMFLGQAYQDYLSDPSIPDHSKEDIAVLATEFHHSPFFYFIPGGTWHCVDGEVIWWFYNHLPLIIILLILLPCLLGGIIYHRHKEFTFICFGPKRI